MINFATTSSTYYLDTTRGADLDVMGMGSSMSGLESAGIWVIIAFILAIVGGILTYFLFVKSKAEPKGKFAKWLKDFLSFKIMWIEPILKVLYYIGTIFVILFSFTFLAAGGPGILAFFMCLILGPVGVRLAYEMTMMFIMIWRNTRDIADKVTK